MASPPTQPYAGLIRRARTRRFGRFSHRRDFRLVVSYRAYRRHRSARKCSTRLRLLARYTKSLSRRLQNARARKTLYRGRGDPFSLAFSVLPLSSSLDFGRLCANRARPTVTSAADGIDRLSCDSTRACFPVHRRVSSVLLRRVAYSFLLVSLSGRFNAALMDRPRERALCRCTCERN